MALSPAPHTLPVFRVLKQAWRDYLATGGGLGLVVNTPAGQAHTAPITVTGTVTADISVPVPVHVRAQLVQGGSVVATQVTPSNATTGVYTTTFPANAVAAGSATVAVTTTMVIAPVNSGAFTLT